MDRVEDSGEEQSFEEPLEPAEPFDPEPPNLEPPVIGPVEDDPGGYSVRVPLPPEPGRSRFAVYAVPKLSWEDWWVAHASGFDETQVPAVADSTFLSRAASSPETCPPDDTWDNGVLDDMPDPRRDHAAVWTGTEMIVWGGRTGFSSISPFSPASNAGRYDPLTDTWRPVSLTGAPGWSSPVASVWTGAEMIVWGVEGGGRYDPVSDAWSSISAVGEAPRAFGQTAVWTGREVIVWGPSQGARYDPSTDSWRPMSSTGAPSARQRHTAVWTGNVMIVWGGEEPSPSSTLLGTGARYDPASDSWTPTSAADPLLPRVQHTAVWSGSEMIIWGGKIPQELGLGVVTNTGARYDPVSDTWRPTSTAGAPRRRAHTAVWTGGRMIVWGGEGDLFFLIVSPAVLYDPATDMWRTSSPINTPIPTAFHSAVWTGSLMIVWGGESYSGFRTEAGGRYDPERDVWSPTSRSPGGTVVSPDSPAVWTGSEMLAWSGQLFGGRYDPMLDAWKPISAVGAPSGRSKHVSIWTGDEMVVWGGGGAFLPPTATGGRYDPVTDTWRATSVSGAPEAREFATAVWTGREVIVWGGQRLAQSLGTGGRYDPSTDTWRATALPNLPGLPFSASFHTAVWTGREMIIWGGESSEPCCSSILARGARYDPERDLWFALPDLPADQGRAYHTAVWTGREMIVYGGFGYSGSIPPELFHPTWLYDRASDFWSIIPTPPPSLGEGGIRIAHTAVWTGRHMLIFGGRYSPIGAVYDHATGAWRNMSTARAPRGRRYHAAVWTGRELIVWGGEDGALLWNGGRYTFGQHSDDDGDGLSECGGDCNDADASAWPGAPEMCNGRDDSCDGVADEDSAGLDTDGDGTANACDTCPELANPGQSSPFACIAAEQDGGACLRAELELAAPVGEGAVTIVGERAAPPDMIELEFKVTSCFGLIQPIDVFLNGELLVSFAEPAESCACDTPVYRVSVSDQALLRSLWHLGGENVLEVRKPPFDLDLPAGTAVAWVAARIGSGREQSSERVCLFVRPGEEKCSEGSLCLQPYWLGALDENVPIATQPREEEAHSSTSFTGSQLPGLIDLGSVPDGPVQLCVGPDGPPRLYAADGAGRIYVVDTASASSTPAGSLPGAVLEIAHDDVGHKTWAQSAAPGAGALEEVDLVGGGSVATSPFLGLPLGGLEFLSPALYGVEAGRSPRVMEIVPESGFSRTVGTLPPGTWDGLTYDEASGQFLSVRASGAVAELWNVDPVTGEGRMLHSLAFEPSALEFGPDGALYAARRMGGDTELHRIDMATGVSTLVGPMGVADVISLMTVRKHPRACLDIVKQGEQTLAINRSCNASPSALAGSDQVAECSSPDGAGVMLDGTGSSDPDSTTLQDDIALYEWIADHGLATERLLGTGHTLVVTLPLGQHAVTLRVTDRAGATGLDDLLVNVVDTTPPSMSVVADPVELWPPNHRMVPVGLAATAQDACDPSPQVALVSVTSSEPDDGPGNGDGHTSDDIQQGTGSTVQLRAEREASGGGRLYAIGFAATDASGNAGAGGTGVMVPHDQGGTSEPVSLDIGGQSGPSAPGTWLRWTPVVGASHYDVLRGTISGLSRLGSYTRVAGATCLAREIEATQFEDLVAQDDPPPGESFFYLVEYFDGRHSGYGTATGQGEIAVVSGDSCH